MRLRDQLRMIRERCSRLPITDFRTADQIIGFDERGFPAPAAQPPDE